MSFHFFWDALYNGVVDQNCIYADITKDIITFIVLSCHFIELFTIWNNCDPASENHQKVARHGFLVKGRF